MSTEAAFKDSAIHILLIAKAIKEVIHSHYFTIIFYIH